MVESRRAFISCEHGGNRVPETYRDLFSGKAELLASHRGFDPGSLPLARSLARGLRAPLEAAEITRLLVDLNRSPGSRSLFSAAVDNASSDDRAQILDSYYRPYRRAVYSKIAGMIEHGAQVLHLSVHSFTPVLQGEVRTAELGLLYDPARPLEKQFCHDWQSLLQEVSPAWRIRCNYPYRGDADGLVRSLRQRFAAEDYLGIELEVNQALLNDKQSFPETLQQALIETLQDLLFEG